MFLYEQLKNLNVLIQLKILLGSITTTIGGGPTRVKRKDASQLGLRIDLINNMDIQIHVYCSPTDRDHLKIILSTMFSDKIYNFFPNELEKNSICRGRVHVKTDQLILFRG